MDEPPGVGPNARSGPDFVSPAPSSGPGPGSPPPPGWAAPAWTASPPPPPRRTPLAAVVLVAVLVAALNAALLASLVLRFAERAPGPGESSRPPTPAASPTPTPTTPTPPDPELGALGRELTTAGYSCTVELPDPLIGGCYARAGDSRSLRWQGSGDRPTALNAYVLSTAGGYDFPGQLGILLSSLPASGVWMPADLAAVRARAAGLSKGQKAEVDTGWGRVTLNRASVSLVLEGVRTGAKVRRIEGRHFPTAIADLEQEAVDLGYRCQRSADQGVDERVCSGATGNELTIAAYEGEAVTSLFGGFVNGDGQSALRTLVEAAAPADAPALAAVLDEAAGTPTLAYRATNGFLILCHRTDAVRCSVYGVGWD